MAGRPTVLTASLASLALLALALSCDSDGSGPDAQQRAAVEAATAAAKGEGFLTGEPKRAEAQRMPFRDAKTEAVDWGLQWADVVGTPPPWQPVWLVRLTGVGSPPGPPSVTSAPDTCLEILVLLNTSPLEDIVIAGRPSQDC